MPSSSATVRYGLPYLYRQRTGADPGRCRDKCQALPADCPGVREGFTVVLRSVSSLTGWGGGSRDSQLNDGWVGNYFCKHCLCQMPGACLRYSIKNFTHEGLGISILAPLGVIFPVSGSTANVIIWLVV